MDGLVRVVFFKAQSGEDYAEVARGAWRLGAEPEPVLTGEPIPPEVLKGLEVQARTAAARKGTITYDRTDTRYAMDYEAAQ